MSGSVLIAVPTRGQIVAETVNVLQAVRDITPGLRPVLYQRGALSVAQTRNRIVKEFLATDCGTLVMVDDDTVPPPHFLERLLPVPDGYGMVGLPTPCFVKAQLGFNAYHRVTDGYVFVEEFRGGWNDVDALGTACVAIPRAVLEELGETPFRLSHDPDHPTEGSDDLPFCEDLRAHGYAIGVWWDGWFADHVKTVNLAPLIEQFTRASA